MIVENGKYYLYRHVEVSSGIPFYVGMGTKKAGGTYERTYARAFTKYGRNSFWNSIYSKKGRRVEIMLESNNLQFIYDKEKEFIKLYGRRILNEGILTNIEKGGVRGDKSDIGTSVCCVNNNLKFESVVKAAEHFRLSPCDIFHSVRRGTQTSGLVFTFDLSSFIPKIIKVDREQGEIFKYVEGYQDKYLISNKGRLISIKNNIKNNQGEPILYTEKIIKPIVTKLGYINYCLVKEGKRNSVLGHKIVIQAFKKQFENIMPNKTLFKDLDKSNISFDNLIYTYEEGFGSINRLKSGRYKVKIKNKRATYNDIVNAEFARKYAVNFYLKTGEVKYPSKGRFCPVTQKIMK